MKKKIFAVLMTSLMVLSMFTFTSQVSAVGEGPNYNGNETIVNERIHNYEELVKYITLLDQRSDVLELEVYGQSVKGRDLYLAKFWSNDENPTFLILTQQHGNEVMTTEGALQVMKNLTANSNQVKDWLSKVNVLIIPRINVDGGEGDVNFSLDNYVSGTSTRYNANKVDLNRDHTNLTQPETQGLHENVLMKYKPDFMIDFHHQGTQTTIGDTDELVSGSILYPTNEDVTTEVRDLSKQLGAVVYNAVEERGFAKLSKYVGGTENTIARNKLASGYGISTLLFELRGMADHYYTPYVLGQKSNGYIIQQVVIGSEAVIAAIADGSIYEADTSFWNTLPESSYNRSEE